MLAHTNAVLPHYQESGIFVLPSLSEGLPLSLLEAMACEFPVIVTAVGGNREIVDPDLETVEGLESDNDM